VPDDERDGELDGGAARVVGEATKVLDRLESQLPAADPTLDNDVLDRIDELVAPGVTINPEDNSYGAAELMPSARR
jgi:hypothetical protein